MRPVSLNLKDLTVLVADPDQYYLQLVTGMLRHFGVQSVLTARTSDLAQDLLLGADVDLLICDYRLRPQGGAELTRWLRANETHPRRGIPILIMTGLGRTSIVQSARDAGANLVINKPVSPAALFDRLAWIAYRSRKLVEAKNYYGPDRRFKFEGFVHGAGMRSDDMSAGEIDSFFASNMADTSDEQGNTASAAADVG